MNPQGTRRIISADPGLLTPEQLLEDNNYGKRRRSLEKLIANGQDFDSGQRRLPFHQQCRDCIRWFLDVARLKLSVSLHRKGRLFHSLFALT
jgi:hypothetical protein